MKREEDIKAFLENLRTPEESLMFLPDLPDDCDVSFLEDVVRTHPIAENPYSTSDLRKGLKIWDTVYLPMPKSSAIEYKRQRDLSTLRSINSTWEKTKESLNKIGRTDGQHYLRPRGEYILDVVNDDIRMLQGAHIMTHREHVAIDDEYSFGQLADVFLRNVVTLFLARKYDLLINTHPEHSADDSFSRFGIEIFGSTQLRAPALLAAVSGPSCRIVRDKTVIAVLGSVGIEAHPRQATKEDTWQEINKWSCLPTLVALAGWEGVDFLTHAERVVLDADYYAISCSDLQGMDSFRELLDTAERSRGKPIATPSVMTVEDWFKSEDFQRGLMVTPQLPCPACIRLNSGAPGVVARPRGRKPSKPFKEIKDSKIPELKEWSDYVTFMRTCIDIGRKATTYASGSVTTMRNRNRAFKKRLLQAEHLDRLYERYKKKMSSGFISEAEGIAKEIEKLKKELQ